ncbi:MAG: DUF2304 domain-containing protein [Bacteroidales bacterium]|nr:DUF2304 domain-containing protein [Clostridium sp.]MCM1202916.1 DUF2304 domain-containing protein [Bacteroidales bacterium]
MSVALRVLLIVAAIVTTIWILRKIRKAKVKMEDSIFWIVFSFLLIVMAVFPQISYILSEWMGIASPANFVFLMIICLLLEKVFTLSLTTSQLEDKVSILSTELALRSQAHEQRMNEEILSGEEERDK